ncbi:MAG: hypothetical protein NT027_09610 [Proteobacteria bacterium]|nr:hypothetical protein [Pseudomonadota bacterium]
MKSIEQHRTIRSKLFIDELLDQPPISNLSFEPETARLGSCMGLVTNMIASLQAQQGTVVERDHHNLGL